MKILSLKIFSSVAASFFLFPLAAREANLINNSTFFYGMKCWRHSGSGTVKKLDKGIMVTGGTLAHYIDLGNLEHAQPDCAAPSGRRFRFRIRAKGEGKFRLGVRARLMYAGNALEFDEKWSKSFELSSKFQNFDFESVSTDPDTVFHDKLMVKLDNSSNAEIVSTSFFYLDRKGPVFTFEPSGAVVRPGDTVKVTLRSSEPNRKLSCSLYPGQFLPGGYFPAKHWETVSGADGKAEFTFTVPLESPDGARLSVLDQASGIKVNFFATIMPEKSLKQYRKYAENISGQQHLLFLGDSLSDYDRGRKYINVTESFLPAGYTTRNCGVGGDTLQRIWLRLKGEKTIRNEMYEKIFSPVPDMIFIFTGANDSKLLSRNNYQTFVPEKDQIGLWNDIIVFLKKQTGAKIVLITSPDSYMPYQQALNLPLKAQNFSHSVFGVPEVHDRFNARLKQIAAKHGLDIIDFAATVRNHPDPQLLYVQDDGVHMSLKGHQLLAGEVLRYLADGKKLSSAADGSTFLKEKLRFNGSTRIRVLNSSEINANEKGLTVITSLIPLDKDEIRKKITPEALDMYVFKERQFFLGRYGNRLYANFHDGKRYRGHTMSLKGKFPEPGKKSQAAAVFETIPDGYSITLYLNGAQVGKKTFSGTKPESNRNFIELGSGWGGAWHYRGEMDGLRIFPRALSAAEIENFFNHAEAL